MDTARLERLLADPQAVERLVQRGARLRARFGDSGGSDGRPAVARRPTDRHLAVLGESRPALDHDHEQREHLLTELGELLPRLAELEPLDALRLLTKDHLARPSRDSAALLEDAVARISTRTCCRDGEDEDAIEDAARALKAAAGAEAGRPGKGEAAAATDSIVCRLYEDRDLTGRGALLSLQGSSTYRRLSRRGLERLGLHDAVTSMWIDASDGEVGGEAILFEDDRFLGRYLRVRTDAEDPTRRVRRRYVGDFMNDEASSLLLVRRFAGEVGPIPLAGPGLIRMVNREVAAAPQLSRRGDPFITWDLWPDGGEDHPDDPGRKLVELRIPVRVDVPDWFDYDGELRYWMYLFLDDDGRPDGYVAWYGAWCNTGLVGDKVLDGLMRRAPEYVGRVETELRAELSRLAPLAPFRRLYYLPGDGRAAGHTDDNVSLVLVRDQR